MKNSKIFFVAAIVVVALLAAGAWLVTRKHGAQKDDLGASASFSDGPDTASGNSAEASSKVPAIIPKNLPVVTSFIGDLLVKGNPQNDGTLDPFVAGESLKLEAEALNAVEYRWTLNGEVLKEKDQEWTTHGERFYDVVKPGPHIFTVQVRSADKTLVSQEKSTALNILPLKILHLSKAIIHEDDEHFITGDTINLEVEMAASMKSDLDFYKYRYFVNDMPIKHPDDDEEWTSNDSLSYNIATPGNYTFKVEARRADQPKAEDSAELPETIVAADAVLLSFDSNPVSEKGAAVGAQVSFSAFPTSRFGKSECRIGVKPLNAVDFSWLKEEDGSLWGDANRTWLPLEPGTYLVRCEIREIGKESADDSREMVYKVVDGNF